MLIFFFRTFIGRNERAAGGVRELSKESGISTQSSKTSGRKANLI